MIQKRILPEGFNFDVPSVEIIDCGKKGLDKTAMLKRASAFDDVLEALSPKPNRVYLHVITTGAYEKYGANRNGDSWNEKSFDVVFPEPEDPEHTHEKLDDGLSKYHDSTYMKGGHVYQEHNTKDTDPSGEVIAAKYNPDMHRGELIIAVDTEKWAPRLQRKAKGQDIFLSIGASVPRDLCMVCGRSARTASEHCDHFKHHRMQVLDNGARCSVMNDTPSFYDISGVDVPADRIAFVLRKVASGEQAKTAMFDAITTLGSRTPMLLTKAAKVLGKLAQMEKRIEGIVDGDEPALAGNPEAEKTFVIKVINYPSDEIIDCCNSKGLLLSPGMLFKLLAKDSDNPEAFDGCDDNCCGDCSTLMRDFEEDEDRNTELLDGSFDQHFLPDVNLANIIESFLPELGMSNPAVHSRSIHIIISGKPKTETQDKEASYNPQATEALRRTYARYVVSFAERNDDATCMNALRKLATYGRR